MPSFLPTGSLTGLAFLASLVLLIRFFRRSKTDEDNTNESSNSRYGTLTASSLTKLIEEDVVRHFLIDVRNAEQVERKPSPELLRRASGGFLQIPSNTICDLKKLFTRRSSGEFMNKFPGSLYPRKDDLIVCVADEIKDCEKAVSEFQSLSFDYCVYLKVGIESLHLFDYQPINTKFISRNSVALLLGLTDVIPPVNALVIDVRRIDELVVYGTIEGTKHLVANALPIALTLNDDEFYDRYSFCKPNSDSLIITSCRTNKRAIWAAHILNEMGYTNVFVHRTGTYGWHFASNVKVYDRYETNETYPVPKSFTIEKPDISYALRELEELQITSRLKPDFKDSSTIVSESPEILDSINSTTYLPSLNEQDQ